MCYLFTRCMYSFSKSDRPLVFASFPFLRTAPIPNARPTCACVCACVCDQLALCVCAFVCACVCAPMTTNAQ